MKNFLKKTTAFLMSVLMAASCLALPSTAFAEIEKKTANIPKGASYVEGEVIAVLNSTVTDKEIKNVATNFGRDLSIADTYDFGTVDGTYSKDSETDMGDLKVATFTSDTLDTEQMLKKLARNSRVKYAFPNYILKATDITDDTYSKYQWALDNQGQNGGTAGYDVNADALWPAASSSKEEQIVAVLDTGIDYNNEDLKDSLWVNPYGTKLVGKYGYDFTGENRDLSPLDNNGHGTHVAGIIAGAADNQKGISGINKSNVKIMSLKWLDEDGSGETDDVIAAYEYVYRAMKLGANVVAINNSWGGMGDSIEKMLFEMVFDLVGEMGAVSFVAAGNEGWDILDNESLNMFEEMFEEEIYMIPAACESEYSIVVAASNENDGLASFSNYNKNIVDIAAPGTDILSTVSYDCFNPTLYTEEEIQSLCSGYQSYDNGISADDFGYTTVSCYDAEMNPISTNATVSVDTKYFGAGTQGGSLLISATDSNPNKDMRVYMLSIAYTLDNPDDNYTYSFMSSATENFMCSVYNLPADADIMKDIDDLLPDLELESAGNDYWQHIFYDVDVDEEVSVFDYEKSAQRQLVFLVATQNESFKLNIDDFAVSKQGVDTKDFGRYDFYNGTSMATPYAAGAYALIGNAYPEATTAEKVNILKNTGRHSDSLAGYTETEKILSLDSTDKVPPMIFGIAYNDSGNISVTGAFTNDTTVSINGKAVTPITLDKNEITVADKGYNTKKITVTLENQYGSAERSSLVSNKPVFSPKKNMETPILMGNAFFLPAGRITYVVDEYGEIGYIGEDWDVEGLACYESYMDGIDFEEIFGETDYNNCFIEAAAYLNGKIYFVASSFAVTSTGVYLGADSSFGEYDLNTEETNLLCELSCNAEDGYMSAIQGYTLSTYNGEIYFIGGYDYLNSAYSTKVFKYDFANSKFTDTGKDIPEPRAFGKAIQYGSKLVYAYGTNDTDSMPSFLTFDGKTWTKSSINLNSDDYSEYSFGDSKVVKVFNGNLGIGNGNVVCLGSYLYGYGDLYAYSVENDRLAKFSRCLSNSLGIAANSYMTTIAGIMVIYSVNYDEYDSPETVGYQMSMNNTYAELDLGYSNYATLYTENYIAMYGDSVNVCASPKSGYAIGYVSANGKKYSANGKSGEVIIPVVVNSDYMSIGVGVKRVSPNAVTNLALSKATLDSVTLSWSKPTRAEGYQIQEYKNKKWVTVKTVTSGDTLSAKLSTTVGAHKYRVRAYAVYDGLKYYGSSAEISVYVPKKQTISSLSATTKGFTVKYSKDTSATGYQIQYSTSSSFSSSTTKTVSSNSTTSYTAKSLTGGKKYYVRVRSYKVVNGQRIYGAWSGYKSVTTKK